MKIFVFLVYVNVYTSISRTEVFLLTLFVVSLVDLNGTSLSAKRKSLLHHQRGLVYSLKIKLLSGTVFDDMNCLDDM